ncbi:MAG: TonB-dependent receptor [Saprospiraceae bacterium]|nr:TonB-dependent receptor [Saprospiraceae bacterium]
MIQQIITGQDCRINLKVQVKDHHDDHPLEFATLFIEESGKAYSSDENGNILVHQLCPGEYHLTLHHFGCDPVKNFLTLHRDTFFEIYLEHHAHALQSVEIKDQKTKNTGASKHSIPSKEIQMQSDKPLASILQNVVGVQTLRNGSTIAIPIIQGLTGTRISLVNHGVLQASQQWGADHAPEIDPFSAGEITVIKGVDAIAYGGNGLGGMILMEPGPILKDPHLHGSLQSIYRTNGRSYHLGVKLEQASDLFDWRITASGKISGDYSTPAYYLTNTGTKDLAFSALGMLHPSPSKLVKYYYAYFHSNPGILRGSHIGNLTDLMEAIQRDTPFFTQNEFSYHIAAPRQKVSHHLFKNSYQRDDDRSFREFQWAAQWNARSEFDVRRSGRSEIPALSLNLFSGHAHWKEQFHQSTLKWDYGFSYRYFLNVTDKETGIIPLIPDYQLQNPGAFLKIHYPRERFQWEAGVRYDMNYYAVDYLNRSIPPKIEPVSKLYHNVSIATGTAWQMEPLKISANAGWTQRSPEIHELYSNGLHQSVAGIEEGDPALDKEQSLKAQLTVQWLQNEWLSTEFSFWFQEISDFIFLEPQKEPRLTIRGAFPVFLYKQTDARLYGVDGLLRIEWNHKWQILNKFSYLRGKDKNGGPLVSMPAPQWSGSIHKYFLPGKKFRKLDLFIAGSYQFTQAYYDLEKDLLAPPPAYFIGSVGVDAEIQLFSLNWHFGIEIENLFNKKYRDYLNRLRYYADEEGRSIQVVVENGILAIVAKFR